jgi:hypothetical protein
MLSSLSHTGFPEGYRQILAASLFSSMYTTYSFLFLRSLMSVRKYYTNPFMFLSHMIFSSIHTLVPLKSAPCTLIKTQNLLESGAVWAVVHVTVGENQIRSPRVLLDRVL